LRYRQLGDSDLQVSEICLGTWTTFGGSLDDDAAIALVDAAFDAGINFFDTANTYSEGRSKEVLGRALSTRPRDSYVLATKLRARAPDGGSGVSRAQVLHQIDQSLERLGAEFVDLYQCHWWDDEVPLAETLEAMTEIVEAGKVRYVGCSNWSGEQIQQAIDLARERGYVKIVSSQPEYSLLHREPEEDVIPASKANGISQVVYSPLAQGVLSGKYAPGEAASEGTRASARPEWMEYFEDDVLERVQRLRPIADGLGITTAQLALAWILREPNVASAIVGSSRPEQLRDNAAASDVDLDQATMRAAEAALAPMYSHLCKGDPGEPEADCVRPARGSRPSARRAVRRRGGADRRLRALLLVHGGNRDVSRRGGDVTERGPGGPRGAGRRAAARDRLPGRAAGRGHRGAAPGAPVRGAGVRHLRARLVKARLFTDGGARGNPGPAAFGYVLEAEDGTVLAAHGEAIGVATNNVAEYRGLVAGLERAAELQVGEVEVVSDSELLVKQMTGEYRVKNEALRALSLEAARLARRVGEVRYTAVRREQNELADRLVNEALDAADLG
jgi:aryl-alcohol dehydrogenase-like predicted oxidoreductase/ribonuclease HI